MASVKIWHYKTSAQRPSEEAKVEIDLPGTSFTIVGEKQVKAFFAAVVKCQADDGTLVSAAIVDIK